MAQKTCNIFRVALIGPESTSKSTLSEQLAAHYNTVFVKEYSRGYLKNIHRKYTLDDVITIAKKQLEQEEELIPKANKLIFADTELIVSRVWCEDVFKVSPEWIQENIVPYKYDLYLLTYYDLPWEADPVRENGHRREFFYEWYERELNAIDAKYVVIKGSGDERLAAAVEAVEGFIKQRY